MRSTPNRATARAWTAERSSRTAARTATTDDSMSWARYPVTPSSTTSGIEPRRSATTGVPHRSRIAQDTRAPPRADRAEEDDPIPVDVRLHGVGEIPLVLHDAADHQPSSGAAGDLDGVSCPLVRMDAPERNERIPSGGAVRKHPEVDAVMDRRGVVEAAVAVGSFAGDDLPVRPGRLLQLVR